MWYVLIVSGFPSHSRHETMLTLKVFSTSGGSTVRKPRVSSCSVVLASKTGEDGGRKDGMLNKVDEAFEECIIDEKCLSRKFHVFDVV